MSAESNSGAGAGDLQFDRAVDPDAAAPSGSPVCAKCNADIRMYYYDVDGETTCSSCKQAVERAHGGGARSGSGMMKAFVFGLGAAIAGAIIYYSVIKFLNLEIGYVAILIGFMVGYAVRNAAAGRGGRRFQFLAAGLTYFAVAMAYAPFTFEGVKEGLREGSADSTASASDAAATTETETSDADVSAEASDPATEDSESLGPVGVVLAIGGGLLFIVVLPVVMIVGTMPSGLISALIIGLGMHTAWSMTRAAQVSISGPFKVGSERPAAAA